MPFLPQGPAATGQESVGREEAGGAVPPTLWFQKGTEHGHLTGRT